MKIATWTTYAALAAAMLAAAPAAYADDASLRDCTKIARQVSQALDAAQPGDARDAARTEETAGRFSCMNTKYDKGVAHYTRALQLLGKS